MIKVIIPTHLYNDLSQETLKDICLRSFNESEFEKIEELRGYNTGQYIKLQNNEIIKYICLSRKVCEESRNAFILQNFSSAFQHYLEEKNNKKSFEYYIRDFSTPHPPYVIFSYKVLLTGGIKILNLDNVIPSNRVQYLDNRTPFRDFKQMRTCRLELKERNSDNKSTLFEENENEISVYGKSYGANGRETTAICLALAKLVEKPIVVYNVNETDREHLANIDPANRIVMNYLGVKVDNDTMDFDTTDVEKIAKRDSKKYHYNLLKKYHEKKCYLCGCDMENLIIGSHIHRVTDILNSNLCESEKTSQIIDGDNGLWLCANHDKMFEWGLIHFYTDKMIINEKLSEYQKEYIRESTFYMEKIYKSFNNDESFNIIKMDGNEEFHIKEEHYNDKMHEYLEKHRLRVEQIEIK